MGFQTDIRTLYMPFQPQKSCDGILYKTYLPNPLLSQYIYYYWEMSTTHALSERAEFTALPDGCIDVVAGIKHNRRARLVVGFSDKLAVYPMDTDFRCFGIRFYPAGFTALTHIAASELTDLADSIENVLPELNRFVDSRIADDPKGCLFLPAAGRLDISKDASGNISRNTYYRYTNPNGYYATNNNISDGRSQQFKFYNEWQGVDNSRGYHGFNVRCVKR